jgi:hypothetical protein
MYSSGTLIMKGGMFMSSEYGNERQVIPGLTAAEVKHMADQVFNWTDGNHPQLSKSDNGFLDILENGKPVISASPVFIRKATL